jgi:hypothetical protein
MVNPNIGLEKVEISASMGLSEEFTIVFKISCNER